MSSVPPEGSRRRSVAPGADASGSSHRTARRVGAVIDPSIDDDGLSLTGPGAPSSRGKGFPSGATEHPVKARLLERARMATGASASSSHDAPPTEAPRDSLHAPTLDAPGAKDPLTDPNQLAASLPDAQTTTPTDEPLSSALPQVEPQVTLEQSPTQLEGENAELEPQPAPTELVVTKESLPPSIGTRAVQAGEAPPPHLSQFPGATSLDPAATLTPPPGAVISELDRIARRGNDKPQGPEMSPNMTALLGGLIGLTVIVTLGMVLSKSESTRIGDAPKEEAAAVVEETEKEKAPEKPVREKVQGPWRVTDDATAPGNKLISGKIGKQAFLRAIQDAGLPKSEAYRAYTALKGTLDLDHCKSSDAFVALVNGREKTLLGFEYIINKEEVYQAKPNEAGHLVGAKLDLKVTRNQIRRSFTYDGKSFEESARRAGFDPGISDAAATTLRGHSALSDFKPGDRFRIIAQEVTVLGEFSRYAGIEAMEILRKGEEPRRIYYYPHPIEGGYFDTQGKAPYEGGWRKPIPDAPRTSPFNMKRMHPVLNKVMPHTGTDFGAPSGTPIGATSPGTVSFIGDGGPSGNLVKVKHEGGYESGYAHLSRFAEGLKIGDHVDRMQLVGYCGSTGRSTGPHLHFTMKKDGVFIDPESLNLDGMRVLAKSHREEFAQVRAKYDPILDEIPLSAPLTEAAPAPTPEPEDPSDPEMGEEEDGSTAEAAPEAEQPAAAPPAPTAAAKPSTGPAAAPTPAKPVAPSAIFLSDEELLRMQSLRDDGEVDP